MYGPDIYLNNISIYINKILILSDTAAEADLKREGRTDGKGCLQRNSASNKVRKY